MSQNNDKEIATLEDIETLRRKVVYDILTMIDNNLSDYSSENLEFETRAVRNLLAPNESKITTTPPEA